MKISEWKQGAKGSNGTSLQGYVDASYKELTEIFGKPRKFESLDGKVSTQWVLENGKRIVTLYDYKETSLYSDDLPSVKTFRAKASHAWHIGAESKVEAEHFALWLKVKLNQDRGDQ